MTFSQGVIDALLKSCNPNRISADMHHRLQQAEMIRQQVAAIHRDQLRHQEMIANSLKDLANKLEVIQAQCQHPGLVIRRPTAECEPSGTCEICGKMVSG